MKDIIENLRFERETRKKNAKKITKEEIEKIIFLSNEQQMSAKEIAEELGVAETRVEKKIYSKRSQCNFKNERARKKFRKYS